MIMINLPDDERKAIAALDGQEIDRLIREAIQSERSIELGRRLYNCGAHIASRLRYFDKALARHRAAKSAKKRAQTESEVRHEGYDLSGAVTAMQNRVREDQEDAERFFVEDRIVPPHRFTKRLDVRVSFRWRPAPDSSWEHGSITFEHEVDLRPVPGLSVPKRKPSAAQQERQLQDELYGTWEHLRIGALCSVRDYLKSGGDGALIPATFTATVDRHSRHLNNYSTQFWRTQT